MKGAMGAMRGIKTKELVQMASVYDVFAAFKAESASRKASDRRSESMSEMENGAIMMGGVVRKKGILFNQD